MKTKTLKGKTIYEPKGKAGEYAKYACNFYNGCSNGCNYCYLKKGVLSKTLGGDFPTLKKCFKDESHALEIFEKELKANLQELQNHGLFFSFTTDPMLPETINLTLRAMQLCCFSDIPIKILTKCVDFVYNVGEINFKKVSFEQLFFLFKSNISIGFTLTGNDELELNASTNAERIEAMRKLHKAGIKTFASIEPIINVDSSLKMINEAIGYCDLFKIGLEGGKKYDKLRLRIFIEKVICMKTNNSVAKIYFKDSLLKAAGIDRNDLPSNCVGSNYNVFNN